MNASTIDGLISVAIGVYVTLVGFGVVSPGKDKAKVEIWRKKWGTFMQIAGPFITAFGIYSVIASLR